MSRRDQERMEALEQEILSLAERESAIVPCPNCESNKVYAGDADADEAVLKVALKDHDPKSSVNSRREIEDAVTRVLADANISCPSCERDDE